MKKILAVVLGLSLLGVVQSNAADAAKRERRNRVSDEVLKKYDKNGDGKLDESERQAMREDLKKDRLKKYDKNGDGKLDEQERAAMREDLKKQGPNKNAEKKTDDKK